MQRSHSSISKAIFLLLLIISSAQAQTTSEKPIQTPERVGLEASIHAHEYLVGKILAYMIVAAAEWVLTLALAIPMFGI